MATRITPLAEIVPGKIDWRVKVRVIRLWRLPEFKNPDATNSIEMIWLDEQGGKIHASVKKALTTKFTNILEEGGTYCFQNLLVAQNDPKFKTTKHKYKLSFIGTTTCDTSGADTIPKNHFDFVVFNDILQATKEDKLVDVIGHIVEKGDIKETEKNGTRSKLIDIVLQDLQGDTILGTLWAGYADQMQQFLDNHQSEGPIVIILQLRKLKKHSGIMGISNSFFGTRLLLNADIPQVNEYRHNMDHSESQLTQVVSQLTDHTTMTLHEDFMHTPRMTISDLYESTDKCFGFVYATIIEVESENGWYYDACSKCMRRVSIVGNKLFCDKCKKLVTAVPSFKLHVKVMDHTGSATFIMFDRVVSQYLDKSAKDLIQEHQKTSATGDLPVLLESFVNKEMLFKVEVSDGNLYQNWHTYTAKKMTNDVDIVQQFLANNMDQGGNVVVEAVGDDASVECKTSAVECGDSNNNNNNKDGAETDVDETPMSKGNGKRVAVTTEDYPVINLSDTQASATKTAKVSRETQANATKSRKMGRVKTEKID